MITESMAIQGLYVISLAAKQSNRLRAIRGSFTSGSSDSSAMGLLTVFAMIALIIAVILLFWVFAKYRRSEHYLNLTITELTINNVKLRQENNELTAANEKLQQENTELYRKQVEVMENIIHEETARK
jgi:cell division protein FtsB